MEALSYVGMATVLLFGMFAYYTARQLYRLKRRDRHLKQRIEILERMVGVSNTYTDIKTHTDSSSPKRRKRG